MNLNEFYESVRDFVLFPGNVDDLNKIDGGTQHLYAQGYKLMRLPGGRKFLIGLVIPEREEMRENILTSCDEKVTYHLPEISDALESVGNSSYDRDQIIDPVLDAWIKMLENNPDILDMDYESGQRKWVLME